MAPQRQKPSRETSVPAPAGKVLKTLRPGQPGTQKWLLHYGEALLCVRYRQDALGQVRETTVELRVDQGPLQHRNGRRTVVYVPLRKAEQALRRRAIEHGATWDDDRQLWRMTWQTAQLLGLAERAQTRRRRITKPPTEIR